MVGKFAVSWSGSNEQFWIVSRKSPGIVAWVDRHAGAAIEMFTLDDLEKVGPSTFSPYVWRKIGPLLRQHGRPYLGIDRPKGYRYQRRRKTCFLNAALIALRGEATYVEGLYLNPKYGMSFKHAWVTLDGKHAIDQTLPNAPKYEYFGIEFPAELVAQKMLDNNYFGPLLDADDIETMF